MTVRLRFDISEDQRRAIRAALGRGGKATRKECSLFIERAAQQAIEEAPKPRVRAKRVKGAGMSVRSDASPAAAEARIARAFGHSSLSELRKAVTL